MGDPVQDAPGLAVAWAPADCARPGRDGDLDGLDDGCELDLARAFAPLLMVRAAGCNWDDTVSPARPGGEYLFAAQGVPGESAPAGARIAYLPAYYRDCGRTGPKCLLPMVKCAPHRGDSEVIILDVAYDEASGRWSTGRVFLSAHCFGKAVGDCRWYEGPDLALLEWVDGRERGAPVVWVADGKHANYPTRAACDRGHFFLDTCDRNDLALRFPVVSPEQNIGSRSRPAGGEGGCLGPDHVGWGSGQTDPERRECFWSADAPFFGWQRPSGERGVTPYERYLAGIAGF